MNKSEHYLKTGGDPRTLPDYTALRDELGKLFHPARPDVNWHYVERLSLSLFEQNGVELQTAAWYTLARTQLGGLVGLNEGLSILEALISHQWGNLWPQQVHARVEILSGLSRRVQQMMRTLPVSYSDLSQLYRAEQQLNRLNEVLQRLELRHLSQFDALAAQMHTSAVRLENSDAAAASNPSAQANVVLPASAQRASDTAVEITPAAVKWVYIAQPPPEANIEVMAERPPQPSRWKPFAAGVVTMLLVGGAGLWGWQLAQRPDPLIAHLEATLSPLPLPLTDEQGDSLKRQNYHPEKVRERTEQQLGWLATLSPDWSFDYGQHLVRQAQALNPQDPAVSKMAAGWWQQLKATALPEEAMGGWQQGMEQLQQLTMKLNALDGQRGKYITVSELKSVVYNATQAFSRSTPAEEQLRLYSINPSDIQRRQAGMALEQLQKRYFLLRQDGDNAVAGVKSE